MGLVIAPDPAVDVLVRVVADLAQQRLAVDGDRGEMASAPLVVEGLAAGRDGLDALPDGIVAVGLTASEVPPEVWVCWVIRP